MSSITSLFLIMTTARGGGGGSSARTPPPRLSTQRTAGQSAATTETAIYLDDRVKGWRASLLRQNGHAAAIVLHPTVRDANYYTYVVVVSRMI